MLNPGSHHNSSRTGQVLCWGQPLSLSAGERHWGCAMRCGCLIQTNSKSRFTSFLRCSDFFDFTVCCLPNCSTHLKRAEEISRPGTLPAASVTSACQRLLPAAGSAKCRCCGYGSKLSHQDMDRRFQSMCPFIRATRFGYLFLTHSFAVTGFALAALPQLGTFYVCGCLGVRRLFFFRAA